MSRGGEDIQAGGLPGSPGEPGVPGVPGELPRELVEYRQTIDNIDAALVHLLAERFRCTKKVGELKAREELPASDPGREAEQIERLRQLADAAGLDPKFAEKFLNFIIAEVIRHHESIRAEQAGPGGRL